MHAGLSREEERGGRRAAPPPFSDMRPNVSVDDQRAGAKRRPAASPLGGDAKKARPKEKNFINVDDDDDLLHFDESKFGLAGMLGGASKEKPKPPPKVAAAPAAGARKKSFVCDSDTDDDGGAPAPKPKKAGGDDWLNWDG